ATDHDRATDDRATDDRATDHDGPDDSSAHHGAAHNDRAVDDGPAHHDRAADDYRADHRRHGFDDQHLGGFHGGRLPVVAALLDVGVRRVPGVHGARPGSRLDGFDRPDADRLWRVDVRHRGLSTPI